MTKADQAGRNVEVLERRKEGWTLEQIGDKYALSREQVRRILIRMTGVPPIPRGARKRGRPCPYCGETSRLLWARDEPDGTTRRRRECTSCGLRWNRIERDEEKPPKILSPTRYRTPI